MNVVQPLILTLLLDDASQQYFEDLRNRYFPPHRLVVGAHVTMFHSLPGAHEAELRSVLAEASSRPGFPVDVTGVRHLGNGVAYDLASAPAQELRNVVRRRLAGDLTRQDAQPWKPHVTVQNKVPSATSRELHRQLSASFALWTATAIGLGLWRYLDGPWEPVERWAFSRQA